MIKQFCIFILAYFSFSVHAQVITTIAGKGVFGFSGEGGPAINAELNFLAGVTADKWGNIYVADFYNNVIQKIDSNGILTRFAGSGASGSGGDGGPASAAQLHLYQIVGMAVDTVGSVYFSCGQDGVRKVNTSGIITKVAGTGVYGYSGDGGPATAAQFSAATGLCFDKAGNLYIADEQSSNIRMVNPAGIISTVAGTTIGFSGDGGPATNAQLTSPTGITSNDSGYIYITDNLRVRKIDKFGIITTFAGCGPIGGFSYCQGCPAIDLKLPAPFGIATDRFDNIYILDAVNLRIYKVTKDGVAYTSVGNGTSGFSGDGGPATTASLKNPNMICFDKVGNLIISDKGNARIRKVWLATTYVPPLPVRSVPLFIYPNPTLHKQINCTITTDTNENATIVITDVLGRSVFKTTLITNTPADISLNVPAGLYFVTAITEHKKMTAKLVVE